MSVKLNKLLTKLLENDNLNDNDKVEILNLQDYLNKNKKNINIRDLLIKGFKKYNRKYNDTHLNNIREREDNIITKYKLTKRHRKSFDNFSFGLGDSDDEMEVNLFFNHIPKETNPPGKGGPEEGKPPNISVNVDFNLMPDNIFGNER